MIESIQLPFQSTITSVANPTVKETVRLHSRRHRRLLGQTVIDGIRPLLVALRAGYPLTQVFICPERLSGTDPELIALLQLLADGDLRLVQVSTAVAAKMSCRENDDGILATAPIPQPSLADFNVPEHPLLLLVEAVEKPGNLGAMLRTAEGAAVDGVIICDPLIDLGNPNVIRASMGTIFTCPIACTTTAEAQPWLRQRGIQVVAGTPEATMLYWDADLAAGTAIAVGAEHAGLSDAWRQNDAPVTAVAIPMAGGADSLNVATAAALLLYEARRQRRS